MCELPDPRDRVRFEVTGEMGKKDFLATAMRSGIEAVSGGVSGGRKGVAVSGTDPGGQC